MVGFLLGKPAVSTSQVIHPGKMENNQEKHLTSASDLHIHVHMCIAHTYAPTYI